MITGVHDIYYNVSKMKEAISFYSQALSMKVVYESEHWTSLDCNGVKIGLHWSEGNDIPHYSRDSHGGHAGGTLTLKSNDIKKDRIIIEKAGGKILGEMDEDWGHMLIFEDLEGNILKLQNPKY